MRILLVAVVAVAGCAFHHGTRIRGGTPSPNDAALASSDDARAFANLDARLDAISGSHARTGNRVELLVDGRTSFARRLETARGADVVLVKTFAFTDDETGRAVADVLIERAHAGAYVVVQYDVLGSIHDPGDVEPMIGNGNEKPIISRLRAAGVIVIGANAPAGVIAIGAIDQALEGFADWLGRTLSHPVDHLAIVLDRVARLEFHDHEKYWITGHADADGHLALCAIIGGMNIGSEYAFGGTDRVDAITNARGWHDVDTLVTGPVVNDIVARFFDVMEAQLDTRHDDTAQTAADARAAGVARIRWNVAQPTTGTARVRFVYNHPRFGNHHAIEEVYAALVDATPKTGVVRIETAYFAPSSLIRGHLRKAIARGTRIAVISNLDTNDTAPVAEGTWYAFHSLLELDAHAALYQRRARPDLGGVMIHCKVASFGTRGPVIVGSANLDGQSAEHNSEGILVIEDPDVRAHFDAMYAADLGADRVARVTLDALAHDPTWRQLAQWAIWQLGWSWL